MEIDDLISLSYLSQYYYCPRRAGLIMLESAWEDNEYTIEGSLQHERVHVPDTEKRGKHIKLYDYAVFSQSLGLSGKCDLIEAYKTAEGCRLHGYDGCYSLLPVEFKHGKVRNEFEYEIQLCAQAMCLEEMFQTHISGGYIFYITAHRRHEVEFDEKRRQAVKNGSLALSEMEKAARVPPPNYTKKCRNCSLIEICLPRISTSADKYCKKIFDDENEDDSP